MINIKKYMKKILIIIFVLVISNISIYANDILIQVPDTNITNGSIVIPIKGSIDVSQSGNDTLEYSFDILGASVDVVSINGGSNCGITSENIIFNFDSENNKLTFSTTKFLNKFTGVLFYLTLNVYPRVDFYYKDYFFVEIVPASVKLNNVDLEFNAEIGKISIDTLDVIQNYKERFSYAFPNPFSYETEIYFSIEEATPLKLIIYNYGGEIVQTIPEENDIFRYIVMDAERKLIDINSDYIFERGLYKIILQPQYIMAQNGAYRLMFITNRSKYVVNVSFVK